HRDGDRAKLPGCPTLLEHHGSLRFVTDLVRVATGSTGQINRVTIGVDPVAENGCGHPCVLGDGCLALSDLDWRGVLRRASRGHGDCRLRGSAAPVTDGVREGDLSARGPGEADLYLLAVVDDIDLPDRRIDR